MEFSAYLQAGLVAAAETLMGRYEGERTSGSLAEMEQAVQGLLHAVGRCLVKEWVEVQAPQYPDEQVGCACGKQAKYVRQREAVSITLHGKIRYRRAYYVCACGQGQCPLDKRLLSVDGFQALFEDGWHELKAGVLWRADDNQKAHHPQYFVDTASIDDFAKRVWAKAWEQGADRATPLVILGDGSVWIWDMAKRLFPNAIHIVDSFQATSYLGKRAADAFGEGTPEALACFDPHKALLHDGHLAALMRACRTLRPKAPTASDAARRYFANHRTRLRYPKYRALG